MAQGSFGATILKHRKKPGASAVALAPGTSGRVGHSKPASKTFPVHQERHQVQPPESSNNSQELLGVCQKKIKTCRSGESVQYMKCLLSKREDPSSIPSPCLKQQNQKAQQLVTLGIQELGRQRQADLSVSLAMQLSPLSKFQARERPCLKQRWKVSKEGHLRLISGFHT